MNIKIIIADDHQLFIDGIKSILSKEISLSVVAEATNGFELIKLLENGLKPDVIITDIRMPIMNGIAATKIITREYPGIPVLSLTMFDQQADVYEMLDAGARGYITKEVSKEELVKAIHTVVAGKMFFSENLPFDYLKWKKTAKTDTNIELTRREKEILGLIARGRTSFQISKELKLSKLTIDTHRKNIHKKLGIKSNAGLVNYALNNL
ncbi:MAG: DNA-binding response regulator [Draconibacterium sp.]|nr:MAG: DNA-binding response regulator [Draconibacterium sp.]PIF05138.1 MAG: DNA-binding response regulator [Draconibacterium sp.]